MVIIKTQSKAATEFHLIKDHISICATKYRKLFWIDNDAVPVLRGHELSKYESMMDCAYVEPNEPQMINITSIKSKHI